MTIEERDTHSSDFRFDHMITPSLLSFGPPSQGWLPYILDIQSCLGRSALRCTVRASNRVMALI